jgi:hypothetical protein
VNPGRYDNMSMVDYRDASGWSKSTLDLVNESWNHFQHWFGIDTQTDAMLLGSAFHCAVLQPSIFNDLYTIAPECDRRTKAGKEMYAEFEAMNHNKIALKHNQYSAVIGMAESVLSHPVARDIFKNGDAEQSFFWDDKETGLPCKCRADYLRRDGIIVDLKKTNSAKYRDFLKSVVGFRYHVQGAFYLDGISEVEKTQFENFILVAVEDSPPYHVSIFLLSKNFITVGRYAYQDNLKTVIEHQNDPAMWGGIYPEIQEMHTPAWLEQ